MYYCRQNANFQYLCNYYFLFINILKVNLPSAQLMEHWLFLVKEFLWILLFIFKWGYESLYFLIL